MDDTTQPRKVMGLSFPTEEEHVVVALGRCRGHAINAAATAVVHATRSGDEIGEAAEQFRVSVSGYCGDLQRALTTEIEARFQNDCAGDFDTVRRFALALDVAERDFAILERSAAAKLLEDAREQVQPALIHLTDCVLAQAAQDQNEILDTIQKRNETLEAILGKMQTVGSTINMISVNASIEAARAGGSSGRAFGIIAAEVRTLASQAATLLDRARSKINESGEAR